jgi:hypothetical protein
MDQNDWYEAMVTGNQTLKDSFTQGKSCVFRFVGNNQYDVFNLNDTLQTLTFEEAKIQLKSKRDTRNDLVRAKDQGYINWKVGPLLSGVVED